MKILKKFIHVSALAAALSVAGVSFAAAPIELSSTVQELISVVDEQGKTQFKAVAADAVVPGDRILYTTTFKNNSDKASDKIVITNPIPKNTRYLNGTAKGEHSVITFSVDNGKSWGTPQSLKVTQKDGTARAAEASDYTNIRWEYRRSLQPAEVETVSFQTQLK
ncbi:DUF11 domain-containing protein [Leucothrix sargassi]|nr:DUF11 domain-containing protein [Leucothrix sargassi]